MGRSVLLLLPALLAPCACAGAPREVFADESLPPAEREVDFLLRSLEARHPDPFGREGEDEFRALGAEAAARLDPADPGAWHLEIRRLVARVRDSHTRVEGLGPYEFTAAPFLLESFPDGWWIVGAFRGFSELIGARLISIDGRPIEEVLETLRPYVSFENEAAFLHAIGATARPDVMDLELESLDGERRVQQVAARRDRGRYNTRLIEPEESEPLRLRHPELVYWMEVPADGVLYVRYTACREDPRRPMADFAAEVESALREGRPHTAIVDLRGNGGGDSSIFAPVIRLFEHGGPGSGLRLVALTDAATFSSGLLNAWQLRERAGAKLAGEASAQRPNCYGEIVTFRLPVSNTEISCSSRTFRIVPGNPEQMEVDEPIALTAEDWFRGRDPVLATFLPRH